jgi:cytochrome c peroxidase
MRFFMRACVRTSLLALVVIGGTIACSRTAPISKEQLGATLFSDPGLSHPAGQACADCHAAKVAFRDPESSRSTSMGVVPTRFGMRNAPTAMYASLVPPLHRDDSGRWIGGLFWDGRAGNLEAQAEVPLLNPLEMNNPDRATVVASVRAASYAPSFRALFGAHALDDVDTAFGHICEALATFERSSRLAPFSSRYDHYLAGTATLTAAELRGLAIFEDPARGNCAGCHPSRPSADGAAPLFTDHSYANLGIPRYDNSKFYLQPPVYNPAGARFIDHGLMATVGDPAQDGKFRVPTLRNIAETPPYGHNGYFENLAYFLDFLNTRDVGSREVGTCTRASPRARCGWPGAEVPATVDHRVGDLGLDDQELADLRAFLETLSDEPAGEAGASAATNPGAGRPASPGDGAASAREIAAR